MDYGSGSCTPSSSGSAVMDVNRASSGGRIPGILEKLKEAIWNRRPILGEIMKKHGGKTLYDYSKEFLDVNPLPGIDERKPELIAMAEKLLAERLGSEVAAKVAKQLTKLPLVSTADHHSVIDHPFWVNANLITAVPYREHRDPDINSIVVFSFASVSANNASGFPRGILFHGGINGSGNLVRLPLLPDRLKMGTVYGMQAFTAEDLLRAKNVIEKKEAEGKITVGKGQHILRILDEFFADPDVLSAKDLSSQITKVNYRLWSKMFHSEGERSSAHPVPDLVYLDIETLVTELLLAHHINQQTLVHKALFDGTYIERIRQHFDGLPGAFSSKTQSGTYMFWGMDSKLKRLKMFREGDRLISEDGSINIALTPQEVSKALTEKRIFPGMMLVYLMVSLYYGMKCLGGFCQVHDLTMMKAAWSAVLRDLGEDSEAGALTSLQTKELGGDGMVLAYFTTVQDTLVPATGIDMALERVNTSYDSYVELAKHITLSEAMDPLLPEMYSVLYGQSERDPELFLKPEEILAATGLEKKLVIELEHVNIGTVA